MRRNARLVHPHLVILFLYLPLIYTVYLLSAEFSFSIATSRCTKERKAVIKMYGAVDVILSDGKTVWGGDNASIVSALKFFARRHSWGFTKPPGSLTIAKNVILPFVIVGGFAYKTSPLL